MIDVLYILLGYNMVMLLVTIFIVHLAKGDLISLIAVDAVFMVMGSLLLTKFLACGC